jgi:glycosyltransferase involved in cell wall biosynthesis
MMGTRGVPAAYGGFETAVEEIGSRMVAAGHEVIVYCRHSAMKPRYHLGMQLVHLPAPRLKAFETLAHTTMSALHCVMRRGGTDCIFLFNSANSVLIPLLRLCRASVALHPDGLEHRRAKWGRIGRRYYKFAESFAVRKADDLIADAEAIGDYFQVTYGIQPTVIPYGSPIVSDSTGIALRKFGLTREGYHLIVARFEPENNIKMALEGYIRSATETPLVVVGDGPYSSSLRRELYAMAGRRNVVFLGAIYDQTLLDDLTASAQTYIHGHSVGGTNPMLLRAMGARTAVMAHDNIFNREVLDSTGQFFDSPVVLAASLRSLEDSPLERSRLAANALERAKKFYDWDLVTQDYIRLAERLASAR